jgi:hypothetical protein
VFGIEIARGALGHGEPLLERVGLPQGAHREQTGVPPFKERPLFYFRQVELTSALPSSARRPCLRKSCCTEVVNSRSGGTYPEPALFFSLPLSVQLRPKSTAGILCAFLISGMEIYFDDSGKTSWARWTHHSDSCWETGRWSSRGLLENVRVEFVYTSIAHSLELPRFRTVRRASTLTAAIGSQRTKGMCWQHTAPGTLSRRDGAVRQRSEAVAALRRSVLTAGWLKFVKLQHGANPVVGSFHLLI